MHSCTIPCGAACTFSTVYWVCKISPKHGPGYGNIFWFIWPLHCMVAPIFHNKCSKNQPKGILDADLHHPMWYSTHLSAFLLVLIRVAHQVSSKVRFLVVCLVLGQVLHPVVFPALLRFLHQIGGFKFRQKWARV